MYVYLQLSRVIMYGRFCFISIPIQLLPLNTHVIDSFALLESTLPAFLQNVVTCCLFPLQSEDTLRDGSFFWHPPSSPVTFSGVTSLCSREYSS